MNRRGFLKNLGFGAAAVAVAPLVSFVPTPKRTIYKVHLPAFYLFYITKGSNEVNSMFKSVNTYNISLQELCERYPDDNIFFYSEHDTPLIYDGDGGARTYKYVRACVVKKDPNMKIVMDKNYEI